MCKTLVSALNADENLSYGGWRDGAGITTRALGHKLAPFGIRAKTVRVGDERGNGYERAQFEDTWTRYLPQNHDTVTTRIVERNLGDPNRDADTPATVFDERTTPHEQRDVTVVTVSKRGVEPEQPHLLDNDEIHRLGVLPLDQLRRRYEQGAA